MDQRFSHIATINLVHEYHGNNLIDCFSLTLSPEIHQYLRNLQLVLKPFQGGFHLISSDPQLLRGSTEPILVRLQLNEKHFFNFTDFQSEFRPTLNVLYFSDSHWSKSSEFLHKEDFASGEDSLLILNSNEQKEIYSQISNGEISLLDDQNRLLDLEGFTLYIKENNEAVFFLQKSEVLRGFYKPRGGVERVPFGLISLHPHFLYEAFQETGVAPQMIIRFKSLRTYWKYILSDKMYEKFENLSVLDAQDNQVLFREGVFEIRPEWKVRSFESEVKIPFNHDFTPRFQLVEQSKDVNQPGKVIYKQLPKASPDQLFIQTAHKEILYSHIFI